MQLAPTRLRHNHARPAFRAGRGAAQATAAGAARTAAAAFTCAALVATAVSLSAVRAEEPTNRAVSPEELNARIIEKRIPAGELRRRLGSTEPGRVARDIEPGRVAPDWEPLPREEYLALRAALKPRPLEPKAAWIERAEYTATLSGGAPEESAAVAGLAGQATVLQSLPGETLSAGLLTADVKRTGEEPRLLDLGPLNLPISGLHWDTGPAVWGVTPDGRTSLVVDRPEGRLSGRWSLRGRRLSRRVEFDVRLAPATVSRLRLRLPAGYVLASSAGHVVGPRSDEAPGWDRWDLQLGGRTDCRLTVRRSPGPSRGRPLILAESDVRYIVGPDELHLQANVSLEVANTPARNVIFVLPDDLKVYSITYGGDVPLAAETVRDGARQQVRIRLPDPLLGRSRTIRIHGTYPTRLGTAWELPRITIQNGHFLTGRLHLKTEPPLRLQSFDPSGYRQTAIVTDRSTGDTLTFQQDVPDARMAVEIDYPRAVLTARGVSHLAADSESWSLASEVSWHADNGSAFSVRYALAPGWEVTEVLARPVESTSATFEPVNWDVQRENRRRVLLVDFADALRPGRPRIVQVLARRVPAAKGRPVPLPPLQPLGCGTAESVLVVTHPRRIDSKLDLRSFEIIDEDDLPGYVEDSRLWKELAERAERNGERPPVLLYSDATRASARLSLNGRKQEPEAPRPTDPEGDPGRQSDPRRSHAESGRPSSEHPADAAGRLAVLKLQSTIFLGDGGSDLHRAVYSIGGSTRPEPFDFELSEPAELVSVRLNGERVTPSRHGSRYSLPGLPDDRANRIEVRYRCPSSGGLLAARQNVVVPRTSYTVLRFQWEFALPQHARPAADPAGLILLDAPPRLTWMERLFGPLGRGSSDAVFNPFVRDSWRGRTGDGDPPRRQEVGPSGDAFAPSGWTMWRAAGPTLPESLALELRDDSSARLAAWIGLLSCLGLGLLARLLKIGRRATVAAVWLSLCGVAAWLAPAVYAQIAGGCLAGTLIAALVPQALFASGRRKRPTADGVPPGSTESFRTPAVIGTFAVAAAWLGSAAAQESPAASQSRKTAGSADEGGADESPAGRFTVAIPEGPDAPPLVYLHKELISQLREAAAQRNRSTDSLLGGAGYRVHVDRQNAVTVEARYRIAVLSKEPTTEVLLPITGAHLDGPDACRVNGTPRPVRPAPDGNGFVVELSRPPTPRSTPSAARLPVTAPRPAPAMPIDHADVSLQLRAVTHESAGGHSFRMDVPPLASSRLSIGFDDDVPWIAVPSARGEVVRSGDGRATVSAELGPAATLSVEWSGSARPADRPAVFEAGVTGLVEVHPAFLEYRCRVAYTVLSGSADTVVWRLPRNAVVRHVKADDLLTYAVSSGEEGPSQLFVEFSRPQSKAFDVEAAFTLPVRSRGEAVSVPALDLTQARVTQNRIGVSTVPEFRLTAQTADDNRVRSIPADSLSGDDALTAGFRTPQFAWQVLKPARLSFRLAPRTPQRTVRQSQVVSVGRNKLDCTFTAEVETQSVPAFRHRLAVDPRLRIQSVHVRADDAERLVHWSRLGSGRRLELSLSDKAAGTQQVVVRGNLPLRLSDEIPLPSFRFEDAETAASHLRIYRDPEVSVELKAAEGLEAIETDEPIPEGQRGRILHGSFRVPDPAAMPRIRPMLRRERATVDSATHLSPAGEGWWRVRTVLRFRGHSESVSPLRLRIPRELADAYVLEAGDAEPRTDERTDGSVDVALDATTRGRTKGELAVTLDSMLQVPYADDWSLPAVTAGDAAPGENLLIVHSAGALLTARSPAVEVDLESLPAWAATGGEIGSATATAHAWRSSRLPWILARRPTDEAERSPRAPLVDTRIWLGPADALHGRTEIILVAPASDRLQVAWPDGAQVRAASVNGRPRAIDSEPGAASADGELSIPLDPALASHRVVLHWSRPAAGFARRLGASTLPIPRPQVASIERTVLEVIPAPGMRLFGRHNLETAGADDYALDRLEGLLAAAQVHVRLDGSPPPTWPAVVRQYTALREATAADPKSAGTELSDRLAELGREIGRLRQLIPASRPAPKAHQATVLEEVDEAYDVPAAVQSMKAGRVAGDGGLARVAATGTRSPIYARLAADASAADFWFADRRVILVALASIGLLVMIAAALRLSRTKAIERLGEHQPLGVFLLGTVWWLWLAPSVAGLALMLLAVVMVAIRANRSDRREAGAGRHAPR